MRRTDRTRLAIVAGLVGSSPDGSKRLAESAYLILPSDAIADQVDWNGLDRGARMARLHDLLAPLGDDLVARLSGYSLEYMDGVGAWTARTSAPSDRQAVIAALDGLPVTVGDSARFYALDDKA